MDRELLSLLATIALIVFTITTIAIPIYLWEVKLLDYMLCKVEFRDYGNSGRIYVWGNCTTEEAQELIKEAKI